jgi:predicted metalloprotease with PDZ domain
MRQRGVKGMVRGAALLAVLAASFGSGIVAATAADPAGTIRIALDAREAPRRMMHVRETIPVGPGPVTLAYPKWIPGEHGPSGPVIDLVDLKITAAGERVAWRRDPADMFLLHVEPPKGTEAIEVTFDQALPVSNDAFGAGPSASARLCIIAWNQFVLYPRGAPADAIRLEPEVRLPPGWRYGTALRTAAGPPKGGPPIPGLAGGAPADAAPAGDATGDTVRFQAVSLTTLIDSPILTGAILRTLRLSPAGDPRPAFLHVAADSEAAFAAGADVYDHYRRLVAELVALFGARHYDEYHFLLALSDHVAHFGLEHHESSDNRIPERGLVDEDKRLLHADLLAHEMFHSWNAKYRRPKGLIVPDYQDPIDSRMLWVYEGLTNYYGYVLAGRSGLMTPDQVKDFLAWTAATYSHRPGRAWRPLEDTGTAAQILYYAADGFDSLRRGVDFYEEGTLLWLEADTLIRRQSGGKKSLDDFCRLFHGGQDGPPEVRPYTEDDLYAALNQVSAHDWRAFFAERVMKPRPEPPIAGIEQSGWSLAFSNAKPPRLKSREEVDDLTDARFSIGLLVDEKKKVTDVLGDSPASRAGLAPGMSIVAVNGRRFTRTVLEDALRTGPGTVEILSENGDYFTTHRVEHEGGLVFPRLERRKETPDLLAEILKPRSGAKR